MVRARHSVVRAYGGEGVEESSFIWPEQYHVLSLQWWRAILLKSCCQRVLANHIYYGRYSQQTCLNF